MTEQNPLDSRGHEPLPQDRLIYLYELKLADRSETQGRRMNAEWESILPVAFLPILPARAYRLGDA